MNQTFDGTEALTYRCEPDAGVINESAIPFECLAEVRNMMWGISPADLWSEQCIDIDGEGYFPYESSHFTAKVIRTDQGLAVRLLGHVPQDIIDCIAEVRNVMEHELNIRSVRLPKVAHEHFEKHGTYWGDIDWEGEPNMDPADVEHPPNVDDAMRYQMADDEVSTDNHLAGEAPYPGDVYDHQR